MDQFYLNILIAVFLVVFVTFLLLRKLKKPANVVLLAGLSDSGKTAIFSKVIFNKPKKSVTSLKENEASMDALGLKLIDIPGTERLRCRYWEQYRKNASQIIYVVDSTTVDSRLRDLSEYLYLLLGDPIVHKHKVRFTIACNKQDLEGAKKTDFIKTTLEKELNAIRATKKGQLGKTSEEEGEEDYLINEEVSLDKLKVNFIETSSNNIEQLIRILL